MNPEIIYFLKVNLAIVVFYGFYRLFFYKDTFFGWRRVTLLSFLLVSFLHPFLNIQDWAKQQEPIIAMADVYATIIMPELVPEAVGKTPVEKTYTATFLFYLYIGIAGILLFRFMVQIFGIIKLRLYSPTRYIENVKIQVPDKQAGPFSFFNWIFILPYNHNKEELKEILTHEMTHARQWHSIDVLVSELLCAVCWFNPFMWLTKREIKNNLEYLADRKVIETGSNSKAYQYHLLGLTHNKQVATLYNNFNVLPLKKRIKMMNKERTKQIGIAKYLIFPILAVSLLLVSNIEAIARTTEKTIGEIVNPAVEEILPTEEIKAVEQQDDPVYEIVHTGPSFPGGLSALMTFVNENIKYPAEAMKNKIEGRVTVQFVINKDGSVSDPKIVRNVHPLLDEEALRVTKSLPKFEPGKNNKGEPVRTKYTMPVKFRHNQ